MWSRHKNFKKGEYTSENIVHGVHAPVEGFISLALTL